MKDRIRKSIVISIAMVFAFGAIQLSGGLSYAEDNDLDGSAAEELAKQLQDTDKDPFDFASREKPSLGAKNTIPDAYDLRNIDVDKDDKPDSIVTPVKFQNPFGTCWGFAAIAAAETSILGNPDLRGHYSISQKQGADGNEVLDLSEKHLVNYAVLPISDKDDPQYGEGRHFADENLSLQDKFDYGGLPIYATSLFSSGMGPNLENRGEEYVYKGSPGEHEIRMIDGSWKDFCYQRNEDWSMPEDTRFKQSFELSQSYMLPTPADITTEDENGDELETPIYNYNENGTLAIKEQLMNNRAVEIGFHSDSWRPNQEIVKPKYISENWAHYTYTPEAANHAVTIVGWDNNYPATNFLERHEPKDENGNMLNGAWLVKNSWGSGEEEFPNYGFGNWGIPVEKTDENGDPVKDENGDPVMVGSGYFWLSYYDQSISLPEALAFDRSNVGSSYYLDQHDYMPVNDVMAAVMDKEIIMSNAFKAEANQKLEQISCQTATPGTRVEYQVFLLSDDYTSPIDGNMVASGETEPYEYGGFHKIDIPDGSQPIIQKDQHYSIVVTQKVPVDGKDQYSFNMNFSTSEEMAKLIDLDEWVKGVVNKGESFLYMDGKWRDFTDESLQNDIFGATAKAVTFDNFPIKGFCSPVENTVTMYATTGSKVTLDPVESDEMDNKATIDLRFKGKASDMPAAADITWSNEGSENLFDMVVKADKSSATITAKGSGTGYIGVTCKGVGTLVIKVVISKEGKYQPLDVTMKYGDSFQIDVYDYKGNVVDPSTIKLASNNTKIFTVSNKGVFTATGAGSAKGTISDDTGAESAINVVVAKANNTLKVKAKTAKVKGSTKGKKGKLKKTKKLKISKVIKFKNTGQGKKTYIKSSGNKKITINKKTGKVTVKKGLKKGTYKVKVKVRAAGNANYKAVTKTVKFKIKVK